MIQAIVGSFSASIVLFPGQSFVFSLAYIQSLTFQCLIKINNKVQDLKAPRPIFHISLE
jgi:hypothetical protein